MKTFKVTIENGKRKVTLIREAAGEDKVKEAIILVMNNQYEAKGQA